MRTSAQKQNVQQRGKRRAFIQNVGLELETGPKEEGVQVTIPGEVVKPEEDMQVPDGMEDNEDEQ